MAPRFSIIGNGLAFELVTSSLNNSTNQAVYPFAGISIGAAGGPAASTLRRRVLVCAIGGNGGTADSTISGITMNGNAMTLGAKTLNVLPDNTVPPMAFAWGFPTFPVNITADFSVTFSNAGADRCLLYVFRLLESIFPQMDSDKVEDDSGTLNQQQLTLDAINGAIELYAVGLGTLDASNANIAFSHATRLDHQAMDGNTCVAIGARRTPVNEAGHVETMTWPGTSARAAGIAAVFR